MRYRAAGKLKAKENGDKADASRPHGSPRTFRARDDQTEIDAYQDIQLIAQQKRLSPPKHLPAKYIEVKSMESKTA